MPSITLSRSTGVAERLRPAVQSWFQQNEAEPFIQAMLTKWGVEASSLTPLQQYRIFHEWADARMLAEYESVQAAIAARDAARDQASADLLSEAAE